MDYRKTNKRKTSPASISAVLLILLITALTAGTACGAAEEERVAKLVEGARAEGKLVVYTTQPVTDATRIAKKFEEKYPFVKVELFRAATATVLNKLLAEARAKKHTSDIVYIAGFQASVIKKEGLYAPYLSPESRAYQPEYKDPEGYWTASFINPYLMGYNTKMLTRKDIPETFEGFLHPRWKGKKIGFDTDQVEWFANMLKVMGEEKGMDFFRKLVAQRLDYRLGHTLITTLVTAGEFPVGTVYLRAVEEKKKGGAAIDWVGVAPVIAKEMTIGLTTHAPHPNTGKLFVDFVLSREGQMINVSLHQVPARQDIDADILKKFKGIKFYPSDVSLAEKYAAYSKQWSELLKLP